MSQSIPIDELLTHRDWMRELARSLVHDDSRADDVLQETWISAMRKPPEDRGSVRGWLATVIRNHARKEARGSRRREARDAAIPVAAPAASADELIARAETHKRVVQAVLDLDEPYRRVLLLRYFEERTPAEIAATLGVPADTVKTQLKRGLAKIRERFDREDGGRAAWCAALLPLAGGPSPFVPGTQPVTPAPVPIASLFGIAAVMAAGAGVAMMLDGKDAPPPGTKTAQLTPPPSVKRPPRIRAGETAAADAGAAVDDVKDPAEEAPPAQPSDTGLPLTPSPIALAVRDLADGSWVPGLPLTAQGAGGKPVALVTDGGGNVTVDSSLVASLRIGDPSWRLPAYTAKELVAAPTLWVHRMATIDGVVEDTDADDPVNLADVNFTASWSGPFAQRQADPWSVSWMAQHRLFTRQRGSLPHPDVNGNFYLSVPAVRGARLAASVAHRRTAEVDVPLSASAEPVRLRLVMDRPLRVRGRIVSPDGEPLKLMMGEFVLAIDPARGDEARAALQRTGGGMTGNANSLQMESWVKIESDGAFEHEFPLDGDAWLVIYPPPSFAPVFHAFGQLTARMPDVTITLDRKPASTVRLVKSGVPVGAGMWRVFEKTPGGPHVSFDLTTDQDGTASTSWLRMKRTYSFLIGGETATFEWTGQDVIDLDQLKK